MAKNFLDENGFLCKRRPKTKTFTVPLERSKINIDYYTDIELHKAKGGVLVHDLEVYPNYFLAAFKNYYTNKVVTFELFEGRKVFDYQKLLWVMHNFCIVGFNSIKFDAPILWLALSGASLDEIYDAVVSIIKHNAMPRDVEYQYRFKIGNINHIDLIEVAPLTGSLKKYAARLHGKRLQDLPYEPTVSLTADQVENVKHYCINDLDCTALLLKDLEPQMNLRSSMSATYGQDLRSKSDAQIAESVICSEVSKLNGCWPKRPKIAPGTSYKYQVPDYVSFQSENLKSMLEIVKNVDFVIKENGQVQMPKELNKFTVTIGKSTYRMGIGGLHSTEETVCYKATEDIFLIDRDVASYYPNIILNQGLYPKHMGDGFLNVYRTIVQKRLKAKKEKDKVTADSLKLTINGSFGKFGSKYSNLYAPDLLIQVTLSGQLSLLMLIEMIELAGIPVLSGNTDGIVILCPQLDYERLNHTISMWENITKFETEETRYKAIFISSVNNYIAIYE
jgi:DNA polymerase elongation subunit (family B)